MAGNQMNSDDQVDTLIAQHKELQREIDEETLRPLPNSIALQALKRQKLRIKDEIMRMAIA
jgi:hypothetical protein